MPRSPVANTRRPRCGILRIQPRQRQALEGPANRDPLVLQLQRYRNRHECECGTGDERQSPEISLPCRFKCEERPQQHREHRALDYRNNADHPVEAAGNERGAGAEERHRAGRDRREVGIAAVFQPPANDQWIGDKYAVERCYQRQQVRPRSSEIPTSLPLDNRQPRGRDRRNGNVRPAMFGRQPEKQREIGDVGGDEERKRRQSAAVDRGDEGNLADDECERRSPRYRATIRKTGRERAPHERVGADRGGCNRRDRSPRGGPRGAAPCSDYCRGRDRSRGVKGRSPGEECRGAGAERHDRERSKDRPRRQRPRSVEEPVAAGTDAR